MICLFIYFLQFAVFHVLSQPFARNRAEIALLLSLFELLQVCHSLHDFTSVRNLEAAIADFFRRADRAPADADGDAAAAAAGPPLFVLQADTASVSMRRIQHTRYLLEKAWSDRQEEKRQKTSASASFASSVGGATAIASASASSAAAPRVVLLVHLTRAENAFAFDFDARWRYVFLDAIVPATHTGLPALATMLAPDATLTGLLRHAQTSIPTILRRNFRTSLLRLQHEYARSEDQLHAHIELFQGLLENQAFAAQFEEAVIGLVEAAQVNDKFDPFELAADDLALVLSGASSIFCYYSRRQ